jgi:hypothetical protein
MFFQHQGQQDFHHHLEFMTFKKDQVLLIYHQRQLRGLVRLLQLWLKGKAFLLMPDLLTIE